MLDDIFEGGIREVLVVVEFVVVGHGGGGGGGGDFGVVQSEMCERVRLCVVQLENCVERDSIASRHDARAEIAFSVSRRNVGERQTTSSTTILFRV